MMVGSFSSHAIGWTAVAAGAVALIGLAFIILFTTIGQPFGTLNDLCIGLAAIFSGILAWLLYPAHHASSPHLSLLALILALAGALVVVAGSALVISGVTGWFLAGLYMTAGNALIGLWLLALSYSARLSHPWPDGLVVFGLVVGAILAVGLAAVPGIVRGIDAQDSAPWFVNAGFVGGLGWMILYPIWCIWLGRTLLLK
jgi:hypothetical protein